MSERNIHPASDAAARVSRFLLGRKRYAGRERIMAVDGYPLNASDLEALVSFVHSAKKEQGARGADGKVGEVPHGDPAWMSDSETLVERHVTDWAEVSLESVR